MFYHTNRVPNQEAKKGIFYGILFYEDSTYIAVLLDPLGEVYGIFPIHMDPRAKKTSKLNNKMIVYCKYTKYGPFIEAESLFEEKIDQKVSDFIWSLQEGNSLKDYILERFQDMVDIDKQTKYLN